MKNEIFIGENSIEKYAIVAENDGWRAKNSAVYLLNKYVDKICGVFLKREEKDREFMIKLEEITEGVNDEYMRIRSEGNNVYISGGRRGILYAVCEFLEKYVGVRFFAIDCEVLPTGKIVVPTDIDYERECSIVEYREVYGAVSLDSEFRVKRRLRDPGIDSAYGYAPEFNGPWHTLSGGYLLNKTEYKEKHPEWFALVNGKRLMDSSGQICLTNEGALNAVVDELKAAMRKKPNARYISVSIDDNNNYCRCENCMKALEKQSMSDLFFGFVNKVAREFKKSYPNTLLHTFAYYYVLEPPTFPMEDNVAVQYCAMDLCHAHAVDDENCPHNKIVADQIRAWSKKCNYLMIWDYTDNHVFKLFLQPNVVHYRRNLRFYAENHMRAYFAEDANEPGCRFGNISPMKCYLFSKLTWDPYMSEEEYRAHMLEFAEGYYGKGGKYIVEYLDLWAKEASVNHFHFGNSTFNKVLDITPLGNTTEDIYRSRDQSIIRNMVPTIPMERIDEVLAQARKLFDLAYEKAETDEQRERIDCLKVHLLYYELFFTMDDILENGTEEEIKEVKEKNLKLVRDIMKFRIKRTLYRGTYIEHMAEMISLCDKSPKHWGYAWWRDANK